MVFLANEVAQQLREKDPGKVSDNSDIALKRSTVTALIKPETDAMFDLSQPQITAISLYDAVDQNIIKLPSVMAFLNRASSLSASRDRLGRQEAVNTIIPRPIIPAIYTQEQSQAPKKSFLSSIFKKKEPVSQDANR